jgi:hypothetical protein
LRITTSAQSGLISARSLTHLHRLQLVAREFFKTMRTKPSKEARAFSMALAALDLPPVSSTTARLVSRAADRVRFQVVHDQLAATAVRLTLTFEQKGLRGPISLGRDQLAECSQKFCRTLALSCDTATTAWFGVQEPGLSVVAVTRGELGPFLPLVASTDPCARALSPLCGAGAILTVTLQRLAADVAKTTVRDTWAPTDLQAPPGLQLAHERRLFVTSGLEEKVKSLVGTRMLIRAM